MVWKERSITFEKSSCGESIWDLCPLGFRFKMWSASALRLLDSVAFLSFYQFSLPFLVQIGFQSNSDYKLNIWVFFFSPLFFFSRITFAFKFKQLINLARRHQIFRSVFYLMWFLFKLLIIRKWVNCTS